MLMRHPYTVRRILGYLPGVNTNDVIRQLRRTTFVNVNRRYLYFAIPKAACTQMKELLRLVENAPPIKVFADDSPQTRRDMFVHARPNVPLPSLLDLDDSTQREVLEAPDFLRMTVVRNPYTRLVSAWSNKMLLCEPGVKEEYLEIKGRFPGFREKCRISFPEFVEYVTGKCDLRNCNNHWRRQVDHTFFPAMNFSLVVKMEKLADGIRHFERHIGCPTSLIVGGSNRSISVESGLYTRQMADRVYLAYKTDFEVLGYDRDGWVSGSEAVAQNSGKAYVSEDKFRDEIIERNLIIAGLYEERDRLRTQLQWVSRLHLQSVISGLVSLQDRSQKVAGKSKAAIRRWLRHRRETEKALPS